MWKQHLQDLINLSSTPLRPGSGSNPDVSKGDPDVGPTIIKIGTDVDEGQHGAALRHHQRQLPKMPANQSQFCTMPRYARVRSSPTLTPVVRAFHSQDVDIFTFTVENRERATGRAATAARHRRW